jgi:hypothetical protein
MRPPTSRRRGLALIEALLIITSLTLILALSSALLVSTVRTTRTAEITYERLATRGQLAERFRADLAGAASAKVQDGNLLVGEKEQITYSWKDGVLERVTEKDGQTLRQEFRLGPQRTVQFVMPADRPTLVVLRISEPAAEGRTASTEIVAALRGDLR